jgi:hypothetical protein
MQGEFFQKTILALLAFVSVLCSYPASTHAWRHLTEGLWLGEFNSPDEPRDQDASVLVLKIDPRVYDLRLLSASEHSTGSMTPKEWANKFGLVAAINASMYQANHLTSTGYMKNFAHFNNPKINSKFGAFLAFNPVDDSVAKVQIIDRQYQGWHRLIHKYNTIVQNYRMISIKQENLWPQTDRRFGIASVGIDKDGNILFIHSRKPYSVNAFNQILLKLPIQLYNAMFVEGGSEAFIYVNTKKLPGERLVTTNDWSRYDRNHDLLPMPNVLGIINSK